MFIRKIFKRKTNKNDIAIIGMSGRFPKSPSIESYWDNLCSGKELVTFFSDQELVVAGISEKNIKNPDYVKASPILEDYDKFDASFFKCSPRDAMIMDPQQRLMLQCAWEVIEQAGYAVGKINYPVGVFTGSGSSVSSYLIEYAKQFPEIQGGTASSEHLGNDKDFLSTLISYKLNLIGPSLTIQTACSTSLVCVHEACQSLLMGECEMALAGAVSVRVPQIAGYLWQSGHIYSHDGHCRAFDANSTGTLFGSGVGLVLLKPLAKALKDGDSIYAIIKGSAINNDGGNKLSYAASSSKGQLTCILDVLKKAKISPESIRYIEAHGTGTLMGDPVEINALTQAFRKYTHKTQFCGIGSIKANLGHLDSAAGIASLIASVLMLHHKKIPPSVNFEIPNPKIDFLNSPFYIPKKLEDFILTQEPYRIGVNSLGVGGTNAFLLLEEFRESTSARSIKHLNHDYFILLSAKSKERLEIYAKKIFELIENKEDNEENSIFLVNLSYTLQVGRDAMEYRLGLLVHSIEDLKRKLRAYINNPDDVMAQDFYIGKVNPNKDEVALFMDDTMNVSIKTYLKNNRASKLLELWVNGLNVDWTLLYQDLDAKVHPRRISVTTYPFLKEQYWIKTSKEQVLEPKSLHPLLDSNVSTIEQQLYKKKFTTNAFYLRDHIVNGEMWLPGSAYLEMARAAGELAMQRVVTRIMDVAWQQPIRLQEGECLDVGIHLLPEDAERLGFEIFSGDLSNPVFYAQGVLDYMPVVLPLPVDLLAIRERCNRVIEREDIYPRLIAFGFDYREAFQTSMRFYSNATEVLQELDLPSGFEHTGTQFGLHPCLMDGVLRNFLVHFITGEQAMSLHVPFMLDALTVYRPVQGKCYAYSQVSVSENEENVPALQVTVCDEQGEVLATIEGFHTRAARAAFSSPIKPKMLNCYEVVWKESLPVSESTHAAKGTWLLRGKRSDLTKDVLEWLEHEAGTLVWIESDAQLEGPLPPVDHVIYLTERGKEIERSLMSASTFFQSLTRLIAPEELLRGLIVYPCGSLMSALGGLARALKFHYPHWQWLLAGYDESSSLKQVLKDWHTGVFASGDVVRYVSNQRELRQLQSLEFSKQPTDSLYKTRGFYLISGGLGQIGYQFALMLAQKYQAHLLLIGRRVLDDAMKAKIKILEEFGAKVLYRSASLASQKELRNIIKDGKQRFGSSLNGIFHAAGVLSEVVFNQTSAEEIKKVLLPKVTGTMNLDEVTCKEPLDFFVVFSSISSETGDFGTGSYALGNRFQDDYIHARALKVVKGERSGKSLSINWPYWEEGGIALPEAEKEFYFSYSGMSALDTQTGIDILNALLVQQPSQVIVASGDEQKIASTLGLIAPVLAVSAEENIEAVVVNTSNEGDLLANAEHYLKNIFFEVSQIPVSQIDADKPLGEYGIDSLMIINLNNRLGKDIKNLRKTLLFEHRTLKSLAAYLVVEKQSDLQEVMGIKSGSKTAIAVPSRSSVLPLQRPLAVATKTMLSSSQASKRIEIAIIGMSGRYPKACDLDEFWQNLVEGKDCIEEIPAARWDYHAYYEPKRSVPGKTHSKWGGFIKDVDKFDPLFFKISPREAIDTDPQERLLLQTVWSAIEDAGYNPLALQHLSDGEVGVYAGVMWNEYQLLQTEEVPGKHLYGNSNTASLANRISYVLNVHGPSLVIDTACSSSLVALHMACEALQQGECRYAVAGGVNLSLHPSKYVNMSLLGLLSTDGRCRSFGAGGDGYVPGEGVGALLLKPLADAVRDGDRIYALIKGSSTNHGGKTNGFTVPNPDAQAKLILAALKKADIAPESISYVETHGTGTALGDPIEMTGLSKAFGDTKRQFCAIGSVKSNVGHLEGAAGVVGVTKVLLQMQHKQLVPSLHSATLNPYIAFEETPFYVQHELSPWEPVPGYPRRAGVSSFGAMGTNAHVILEEYIAPTRIQNTSTEPALILLSAKNKERLLEYVRSLLCWMSLHPEALMRDLAYTLQIGREAMEERLGFLVTSRDELKDKVERWLAGEEYLDEVYQGNIKQYQETLTAFAVDDDLRAIAKTWVRKKKYSRLLEFWVKGLKVDWKVLYEDLSAEDKPLSLSAPGYPFAREHYWFETNPSQVVNEISSSAMLHPLLHENRSTLWEMKYRSYFTGEEFFLKDHIVQEHQVLPGVAYLEMVRVALAQCREEEYQNDFVFEPLSIENILWSSPIVADAPVTIYLVLYPESDTQLGYEVRSANVIHCRGQVRLGERDAPEKINMAAIMTRCPTHMQQQEFYEGHIRRGLNYGASFQGVKQLWYNESEALVELAPIDTVGFVLSPTILDSAIQAGLVLSGSGAWVPFSLKLLHMYSPLDKARYSYLKRRPGTAENEVQNLDIWIVDSEGTVLLEFTSLSVRKMVFSSPKSNLIYVQRQWQDVGLSLAGKKESRTVLRLSVSTETGDAAIIQSDFVKAFSEVKKFVESRPVENALFLCTVSSSCPEYVFAALTGLLRTAAIENPKVAGKVLQLPPGCDDSQCNIIEAAELSDIKGQESVQVVRYLSKDHRQIYCMKEINIVDEHSLAETINSGQIYLITGGAGGLGRLFASYLLSIPDVKVVLMGRSSKPDEALPEQVFYLQGDVGHAADVERIFCWIEANLGGVSGIIHSAGLIRDNFILKKTIEEVSLVLSVKIQGAWNLHEAAIRHKVQRVVFFSSLAGVVGNPGQADYAGANAFLDAFARFHGYQSIAWPLWKEGGMQIDEVFATRLQHQTGMQALDTETGLQAFSNILAHGGADILVAQGNRLHIHEFLFGVNEQPVSQQSKISSEITLDSSTVEADLLRIVSGFLKVMESDLDVDIDLIDYGVDSIQMVTLLNLLEAEYSHSISPAVIIEERTIHRLALRLVKEGIPTKRSGIL